MQFTVGHKTNNQPYHVVIEADDALTAALCVKETYPDAIITYVRPTNKRGDARHPVIGFSEEMIRQ